MGHRACHRWARWWARRGTGSLSADCCYSNLLNLLRVKTRVCSYNLYATPFWSYPSQFTWVKLIKLKRTQTVCTGKERKREKTERKRSFFNFFLKKNWLPPKKYKKIKKMPWHQGSRAGVPCHPGARVPILACHRPVMGLNHSKWSEWTQILVLKVKSSFSKRRQQVLTGITDQKGSCLRRMLEWGDYQERSESFSCWWSSVSEGPRHNRSYGTISRVHGEGKEGHHLTTSWYIL